MYTRCDIARSGCTQLLTPRPWSTHAQHGRRHRGRHLRRHAASNAINLSPGVPRHLRHRRPSCRRLHRRRATSASASVTSSATPLLGPSPAHAVGGCQETRPWAVLPCCSYRAPEPTTGLPPGPHSPAGPHSADRYRSLASRLPRLGQGRTSPHRCDHSTASRDPATCLPFLHCPVGTGSPHSVQTVVHFLSLRRQDIPPRNIQSNTGSSQSDTASVSSMCSGTICASRQVSCLCLNSTPTPPPSLTIVTLSDINIIMPASNHIRVVLPSAYLAS